MCVVGEGGNQTPDSQGFVGHPMWLSPDYFPHMLGSCKILRKLIGSLHFILVNRARTSALKSLEPQLAP